MNRPSQTWILFGLSLIVLLVALGKVTVAALALDDARRHALDEAVVEERTREAVTRLDRALLELLARESAWSPDDFTAIRNTRRAFVLRDNMYVSQEVSLVSPLLVAPDPVIALRFEYGPGIPLRSPQVPDPEQFNVVLSQGLDPQAIDSAGVRLDRLRKILEGPWAPAEASPEGTGPRGEVPPEAMRNQLDRVTAAAAARVSTPPSPPARPGITTPIRNSPAAKNPSTVVGSIVAIRVAGELLWVRPVTQAEGMRVQGCWIDWPVLQQRLRQQVSDLLPQAELHLDEPGQEAEGGLRIAVLEGVSLDLLPGPLDLPKWNWWTPVRVTLALAWVAVLCAALAVGLLLNGAVSLSERRAAFVSAVTHELRTPLTTFKMYSEMLATGMIPEGEVRKKYLDTLCAEADRLGHLVENVLAYARIERGSARSRIEAVTLGQLLDRIVPRLNSRAETAGTRLRCAADESCRELVVHVDSTAVEQILFNLVDNACKYGTGARVGAAPIEIETRQNGPDLVAIRVRDHGPGLPPEVVSKLFQPFCKSADEAARSAPGVGLGLALCRRLVRSMGGNLHWDSSVREGACFEVNLPRVRRGTEPAIA